MYLLQPAHQKDFFELRYSLAQHIISVQYTPKSELSAL